MIQLLINGFKINAFLTIISRITGFIRDIFFAYFIGAGIHSDIFFISSKVPNLFRRITAEGAFTASFLPIYSRLLNSKNKDYASKFSQIIFLILFLTVLFITVILEIFMEEFIFIIAPGFYNDTNIFNKIVYLARFTIIFMPLISLISFFGAMLNASAKFAPFAFTPIILNICLIFSCLFISENLNIKSLPLAFALPFSGFLQLIFIFYFAKKYKLVKRSFFNFNTINKSIVNVLLKPLKQTLSRFLPAVFSAGILQINILVDTLLASFLGTGFISYLYYADRLIQLPLGIIGVALGTSLLSTLSIPKVQNNKKLISDQIIKSLKISIFFSIPAMLIFLFFPKILVDSIFQRGQFYDYESTQTVIALFYYAAGVPFMIITKTFHSVFLAHGETKKILYVSILQLFLNVILSIILMQFLSHGGIALATSITTVVGCIIYLKIIINQKRIFIGSLKDKENWGLINLTIYLTKVSFVSITMILILELFTIYLSKLIDNYSLLYLFIFAFFGFIFYLCIAHFMKLLPNEIFKKS